MPFGALPTACEQQNLYFSQRREEKTKEREISCTHQIRYKPEPLSICLRLTRNFFVTIDSLICQSRIREKSFTMSRLATRMTWRGLARASKYQFEVTLCSFPFPLYALLVWWARPRHKPRYICRVPIHLCWRPMHLSTPLSNSTDPQLNFALLVYNSEETLTRGPLKTNTSRKPHPERLHAFNRSIFPYQKWTGKKSKLLRRNKNYQIIAYFYLPLHLEFGIQKKIKGIGIFYNRKANIHHSSLISGLVLRDPKVRLTYPSIYIHQFRSNPRKSVK